MSARASAYAKSLVVCPNGERVTRGEKLVLIVLADNHQDKARHFTYPSLETIAVDALCDRRSCQRHLAALERKGVIARRRPAKQGAGMMTFYFFLALDEVPEGREYDALFIMPEGRQNDALFATPIVAEKGGKRAAEGRHKGDILSTPSTNTNLNQKQKQKQHPPLPPLAGEGGLPDASETLEADCARAELPHPAQLSAPQREHLATCRPEDRGLWEAYYRETNRAEAEKQRRERREEAFARAAYPDRDAAVRGVMRACSLQRGARARSGIAEVLGQVLDAEFARGHPAWRTGPRLVRAWQAQQGVGESAVRYGPLKFFRDGHWVRFAPGTFAKVSGDGRDHGGGAQ